MVKASQITNKSARNPGVTELRKSGTEREPLSRYVSVLLERGLFAAPVLVQLDAQSEVDPGAQVFLQSLD